MCYVCSPCSALAGEYGTPGFAGEVGPTQSTLNALSAMAFEDTLVPRVGSALPTSTFVPGGERGSVMVDDAGRSSRGVRFGTPAPDLHLYSDASQSGWGAHLLNWSVSGVWSEEENCCTSIFSK